MLKEKRLEKYIERRIDERDRMKRRENADKVELIVDRKQVDFWCKTCKREYRSIGRSRKGINNTQWYVGRCVCGKYNIRRMYSTDPYLYLSKILRRERVNSYYDTIDPTHEMFDIFYGGEKRL